MAPAPVTAPSPAVETVSADEARERELGQLLFEAEESLARGAAEKAAVLASRAVKEWPESLTARALHERARRELLRGRRRERLEARVREAEGLLAAGDAAGAERIVTSALKLIPNHPVALALFARLKERRQQAPTAEAWAEQELERLTQARARRALEAAQAEMAAGRERAAMMAIRRGLRLAPDDPELLAMLREVEKAMERGKAGQHAAHAQVRAGLDLLAQGQLDDSLKVLRAVLRADPDNVRAQVAVQQVRKTWLRRQAVAAAAPPVERPAPTPAAAAPPAIVVPPPVPARAPARPVGAPSPAAAPAAIPTSQPPPVPRAAQPPPVPRAAQPPPVPRAAPAAAAQPASWQDVADVARGKAVAPRPASPGPAPAPPRTLPPRPVVAAPAPEGRTLPVGLIVGAAALVAIGAIALARRGQRPQPTPAVAAPVAAPTLAAAPTTAPPAPTGQAPGPLDTADPELRRAVETVLAAYGRALETADAALLAEARPDLGTDERARLIAPFTGALNAASDLRVLDVKTRGDFGVVTVLRTDVIVGGQGPPRDPTEETLRFWRRRGEWVLVR